MDSLEGFVSDDTLTHVPLRALGWDIESVPWRRPVVDWSGFDAVVIRSTWDYQQAPEAFVSVLEQVSRSGTHLENPLDLVRWNMNKRYLRDLERRGVPIVPTVLGEDVGPVNEKALFARLGTDTLVLKPAISASADHTYRLTRGSPGWRGAIAAFAQREYLAQPFVPSVVARGEYSLFFFNGDLSHAVLKTPQFQDFRVQEEHGGTIRPIVASRGLVVAAERAMNAIRQVPLYARVDLVRLGDGRFGVMELELIEPALYFRTFQGAAERFARAFDKRMRGHAA
jgi:hypothetical protein